MTTTNMPCGYSLTPSIFYFLAMCAARESFEFSIKCVGASRSFPPPLPFLHHALLLPLHNLMHLCDEHMDNILPHTHKHTYIHTGDFGVHVGLGL